MGPAERPATACLGKWLCFPTKVNLQSRSPSAVPVSHTRSQTHPCRRRAGSSPTWLHALPRGCPAALLVVSHGAVSGSWLWAEKCRLRRSPRQTSTRRHEGQRGADRPPVATLQSRLCSELPAPLGLDSQPASSSVTPFPALFLGKDRKPAFGSWLPPAGFLPFRIKAASEEEGRRYADNGFRLLSASL